jgi:ABC-type branched-subunit amino acid transport system ATPase component
LDALTKRYGGIRAVDACSFDVQEGSITALIGPNGAGKSTVFNIITGLVRPDSGRVLLRGREMTGRPPHQILGLGLARTFQLPRICANLTVLENVVLSRRYTGFSHLLQPRVPLAARTRALARLEMVGLAAKHDEPAGALSHGQQKLVELAAALMSDPTLVLLDEPLAGINPTLAITLLDAIAALQRHQGTTFLIVEHKMDAVMTMCTPIIVMAYGRVLSIGRPDEIQRDDAVLEAYLGGAA